MSNLLNQIALYRGTDKSSEIHNYCNKYEKYLPFKRDAELNILEIGVLNGESLRTWRDYYYRAKILGIDINPECKEHENNQSRIFVEIGSQVDPDFLSGISETYGPFDMILDDGSHMNTHMIYSFEHLWSQVNSGGVYVIEDIGCSYWDDYEGGFRKSTSAVEYFKRLCDDVNFRGVLNFSQNNVHARREDWCIGTVSQEQPDCRTDIESINFLNGIIIITKR